MTDKEKIKDLLEQVKSLQTIVDTMDSKDLKNTLSFHLSRFQAQALKAGKKMTVVGYSKRGTETTDTYTLIGFTSAYNSLQQDC